MRVQRWLVAGGVIVLVVVLLLVVRNWRGERERHATGTTTGSGSTATQRPVQGKSGTRVARPRPKPPAGGLRLEGQVIDEADQPVAGATVRFYNYDQEAVTAEDGSFVFEHLGPDDYQVIAESKDTWCDMVRVTLSDTSEPVILRLHPGAIATVHVVDADGGKPIAGARVRDEVSDANGDIRIHGLRPGGNDLLIVGVEADGYEQARVKIMDLDLATPADNVFTIELRRGVSIGGKVVGPSGEMIDDGYVTAEVGGRTRSEVDLAADGTFRMWLGPGTFEVTGSSNDLSSTPIVIEVGTTPRADLVLRLKSAVAETKKPATLTGIVVDERGKPVGGATVAISAGSFGWSVETGVDGRFSSVIEAGTSSATVSAHKDKLACPDTMVELVNGRGEVRLELAPSTIAGIVVDTRGRPAPGVRVGMRSVMEDASAITDAKGRFELGGLTPGDHALIAAHVDAEYAQFTQGVVASTGDRDVRLVVTDVGTVSGRVVLDGKPVTYFGAFVHEADQLLDQPVLSRAQDGRFKIKGIVAGTWSIVLAGPSFARKTVKVVVPEDGDVELGDIAVDRGRSIRGRVTDANGPVAGALVTVHESDRPRDAITRAVQGTGVATTDASGAYRINALAPSLYTAPRHIIATHPTRGVSIERPLADTDVEVNLVLAKPGGIDGRLEGLDTGVLCARVDERSFVQGVSPADGGRFSIDNLAPGAYRLRPNGLTAATAIVNVVSGQRAKVSLVVPPERIEVQIAAAACKTVTLATEDGLDVVADEACTIANVPPGGYRACADTKCASIKVLPAPAKQSFDPR